MTNVPSERIQTTKVLERLALWAMVSALAGCVTVPPTVYTRQAAQVNFAAFKTFAFVSTSSHGKRSPAKPVTQLLKNDVTRRLQARGYVRSAAGNASDLLVTARLTGNDGMHGAMGAAAMNTPAGNWRRGGPGYPDELRSQPNHSVTIKLIDRANKSVIWSGTAVWWQPSRALASAQRTIRQAITQIFRRFPGQAAR